MAAKNKFVLLTLHTFSLTGGIEKVSKVAGKALYEIAQKSGELVRINSMYDLSNEVDECYFPSTSFKGFNSQKAKFIIESVKDGIGSDAVVLSHINLLLVGFLIKIFSPKTKLILLAHGIEVWKPFLGIKKIMLQKCDALLAVSSFTKERIIALNEVTKNKVAVLNNCLDPFLEVPQKKEKDDYLLKRYNLNRTDTVLMCVTRLSIKEKYKGYDKVMFAMTALIKKYPTLKYLIVGKYHALEKTRLDEMIKEFGLANSIIFAGYVPDEELADHYNLADIYCMPSEKEGFGIVFIEAMFYGKPVIAGNIDGSVDALNNGEFGLLVNPDNPEEIIIAIEKMILDKEKYTPEHEALLSKFGYPVYKNNLQSILEELNK